MKLSSIAIALACGLNAGSAMTLEKRNYHTCQTSNASPRVADCKTATSAVVPDKCYGTNRLGSGCQTITTYASCRVSVCRNDGLLEGRVLGSDIKSALRVLLDSCSANGKVGGYYHYPSVLHTGKCPVSELDGGPYKGYLNVEFSSA